MNVPGNGQSAGAATVASETESKPNRSLPGLFAVAPVAPRLLNLNSTASYLALSVWSVRALEATGVLRRVHIPLANQGELRKLLFDRADLDKLIELWKA